MTVGSARAPAGNPLQARHRRRWWSYVPVRATRCASGRYACIHVHAISTVCVGGRVARRLGYIRIRWTYRNRASAILLCLFNMCNRQRAQIQSIKSINDSIVRSHCDTCASSWVIADAIVLCPLEDTLLRCGKSSDYSVGFSFKYFIRMINSTNDQSYFCNK